MFLRKHGRMRGRTTELPPPGVSRMGRRWSQAMRMVSTVWEGKRAVFACADAKVTT